MRKANAVQTILRTSVIALLTDDQKAKLSRRLQRIACLSVMFSGRFGSNHRQPLITGSYPSALSRLYQNDWNHPQWNKIKPPGARLAVVTSTALTTVGASWRPVASGPHGHRAEAIPARRSPGPPWLRHFQICFCPPVPKKTSALDFLPANRCRGGIADNLSTHAQVLVQFNQAQKTFYQATFLYVLIVIRVSRLLQPRADASFESTTTGQVRSQISPSPAPRSNALPGLRSD